MGRRAGPTAAAASKYPKPGVFSLAKARCIMHDITAAGHYMVRRSRFGGV